MLQITEQPDPPSPVLERMFHSPTARELAASFTEQSQLRGCRNLIMPIPIESPYLRMYVFIYYYFLLFIPDKCDSVYTPFEESLLSTSLHALHLSWGPVSHVPSEAGWPAPCQINRRTVALRQGLQGAGEREKYQPT